MYYKFLQDFLLIATNYTSLSSKTDGKFEISTPDLPRTHLIPSHLAVEARKLDTQKPRNGATCHHSIFCIFHTKKFLLIFNGDLEIVFINIIFSVITEWNFIK